MASSGPLNAEWLAQELARQLTAVLETMAGAPIVTFTDHQLGDRVGEDSAPQFLWWEQPFSIGPDHAIWIGASSPAWERIGKAVLDAAESTDQGPEALRGTYLEIVQQTLAGMAAALCKELKHEISPVNGHEAKPEAAGGLDSFSFDVALQNDSVPLVAMFSSAWSEAASTNAPPLPRSISEPAKPNTIDLLLDVELPVSISFGRTQLPLKDVIKLTTGSIVELNRSVAEPVEVIVNNCVIARAEVVVVDGNFGIRIQEVVSRQERLRTLN